MLRTNLSTRPFYNERLVHLLLVAAAAVVVALTVFNALRLQALTSERASLVGRIREAESKTATLRSDTAKARVTVDRDQLAKVVAAAREANDLIDQRTFSWTELLNRLETTLPDTVRVQAIKPGVDRDGHLVVQLGIVAHEVEDVEAFIEQLEGQGGFDRVVSRSEAPDPAGLLEVVLEGRYRSEAVPKKTR
jgi:Tfp pilus assembly protein PilN